MAKTPLCSTAPQRRPIVVYRCRILHRSLFGRHTNPYIKTMNTEIKIVDRLGTELTVGMRVAFAVTVRFGDALRIGIIEEVKIDHVANTMHKVKVRYTSTDWKNVSRNIAVEVNAVNVVAV